MFPSHAQMMTIRDEAQVRKQAIMTFGHQGVADLAVLGAILGNHIREIGRYKVTCDGQLVQGRYTLYELVHSGVLSVTGRGRSSTRNGRVGESDVSVAHGSSGSSSSNSSSSSSSSSNGKMYPTTLANLFPALVFKTLRKKSIRPPKFQHDDDDDNVEEEEQQEQEDEDDESTLSGPLMIPATTTTTITTTTVPPPPPPAVTVTTTGGSSDPMLITSETVLSNLVQQRLYRVKDLPLPQELCFLGAVSLPLPRVLRAMHVAWTMDFLNTRVTTSRRQRRQLKATTTTTTNATGGLEFRPDIYAHKMRVARLARAKHQFKSKAVPITAAESMFMRRQRGPTSTSIPEENEDDEDNHNESTAVSATPIPSPSPSQHVSTTTAAFNSRPNCQARRLIQPLLSLENKVPRAVRQWAAAARSCFAEELIQEDRQVQEWVERHRAQVALRYGASHALLPTTTTTVAATIGSNGASNGLFARRRPVLSPISTSLANSILYKAAAAGSSPLSAKATKPIPVPGSLAAPLPASHIPVHPLSATRASFSEGVRSGTSPRAGWGIDQAMAVCSRPTSSVAMANRLSASQQMLSMHLWLSMLISPLSPEYMVQDHHFGRMDSQ
ncbi:hypothetical protein BGX31_002227 [Mortierella sp. GBA43]|nr:hypothetical protein BGX31_002227 [Mortierella sp. GBA43]